MSISLIVKKFIAGIIAILMPITSSIAARQIQPPAETNGSNFHASEVHDMPVSNEDYVDESAPAEEESATTETPAEGTETTPEAPAEGTEATPEAPAEGTETETPEAPAEDNQGAAPVAEWDISSSDEDDVHMYYYNEEDSSILDTITASVKALFVPITAYADTTVTEYNENAKTVSDEKYENGTVVIDGDGATEQMLFIRWLNADKFVAAYENWCTENNLYGDAYILREYVDNKTGTFTGDGIHMDELHELYADLTPEEANQEILKEYFPTYISNFVMEDENFWEECAEFIPQHIIINGNVTDINFCAFAFCTQIQDITINSNVERIQTGAFTRTGITELTLPETVKEIGANIVSECLNLENIYVKGSVETCDYDAFVSLPMGSNIICDNYDSYVCIGCLDPSVPAEIVSGETKITTKYNRRTTLVYNVPVQEASAETNNTVQ